MVARLQGMRFEFDEYFFVAVQTSDKSIELQQVIRTPSQRLVGALHIWKVLQDVSHFQSSLLTARALSTTRGCEANEGED